MSHEGLIYSNLQWQEKATKYWQKLQNLKHKLDFVKKENQKLKARLAELEGNK